MENSEGFLYFARMSKSTMRGYMELGEQMYAKSGASAGGRFSFVSDTDFMKINYRLGVGSSHTRGVFDFWVDGVFVSSLGEDIIDGVTRSIEMNFKKGEKEITVYFPNLAQVYVSSVEVSDTASVLPASPKSLAVFYGDSITQGYIADMPSLSYPARFARLSDMDFHSFGIGGDIFNTKILQTELDTVPKIVFTAYGTNDWGTYETVHALKKAVREYFTLLCEKYKSSTLVYILPVWRADCTADRKMGSFEVLYKTLAETVGEFERVNIIRGTDLIPHTVKIFADRYLHPNDTGFEFYAASLFEKCQNNALLG